MKYCITLAIIIIVFVGLVIVRIRSIGKAGELHIESSPLGSRFDFILPANCEKRLRRKYILVKVIRSEVPEEEHEKYILKEKE